MPGKSYGQRSLAGYSSWGHKESDTAEQLNTGYRELWLSKLLDLEDPVVNIPVTSIAMYGFVSSEIV